MVERTRSKSRRVNPSAMTDVGRRMSAVIEPDGLSAKMLRSESLKGRDSAGLAGNSEFSLPHEGDDDDDNYSVSTEGNYGSGGAMKEEIIAAKENKQVFYSKLLVMGVLLASAGFISFITYWFVSGEEEDDYQVQFANDAKELIGASDQNVRLTTAVLQIFSTLLSSSAKHDNATWPFFTLPDFEKFGQGSRQLSGALLLAFTPLVDNSTRAAWETYSVEHQDWISEGLQDLGSSQTPRDITPFVYRKTLRSFTPEVEGHDQYSPVWQMSPAPSDTSVVNFNLFNHPTFKRLVEFAIFTRQSAISEVLDTSLVFGTSAPQTGEEPQSVMVLPVFENAKDPSSKIIGHVVAVIPWGQFFENILQEGHDGVYAVLEESCGSKFTYVIRGGNATFLGTGDLHDSTYDSARLSVNFRTYEGDLTGISGVTDHCQYTINVYPSVEFQQDYESNKPVIFCIGVLFVFLFTSAVFVLYDCFVQRRQEKVNTMAVNSNAIVTSLFPAQVRDKLYKQQTGEQDRTNNIKNSKGGLSDIVALESHNDYHNCGFNDESGLIDDAPPIADLFPSATVLFMDIAGFTAWSSTREPSQVFILLETIYRSFDKIAKHRRVFKVETIGDCYVAVCGLPEPNERHAETMARFARDCMEKMNELTRKLEVSLGPDTTDLAMRVGLHSGPVTAGVLRGDRARFQLFGDTVNTAARMESTGIKKKIQVSHETAELIIASGKAAWIKPREDVVHVKGKGELQTFWLLPKREIVSQYSGSDDQSTFSGEDMNFINAMEFLKSSDLQDEEGSTSNASIPESTIVLNERVQRLVDYTSDILLQILKKIHAKRSAHNGLERSSTASQSIKKLEDTMGKSGICLEEVVEIVALPTFDSAAYRTPKSSKIKLDEKVVAQLNQFVEMVAGMYRHNSFHNFDHASHVMQSTSKLLSRIVAAKHIEEAEQLHDHTYGITSDPLTQFAIVFSSLIHDVDHRGVPNFLLQKEDPALGAMYRNQAVAEQNSVDVAWNLLMDPSFEDLRKAVYSTESEMRRFRQLVVNSLMATDIFDKELAALRKKRWENAFFVDHKNEDPQVSTNRKATIVIEHIIQASDVSHTMQHWHVYSKWNGKLYHEMFSAYCQGRSDKDPTKGWYEGELWFFDNYVIPLAHKLKECGVFGVSSDEYLNYAMANRHEWEKKGKDIVAANFEKYKKELKNRSSELSGGGGPETAPLPRHE